MRAERRATGGPWWPGWDIARSLRVAYDSTGAVKGAYILTGWGSVHPVGTVPNFTGGPWWPGWDIASHFDIVVDGSGDVKGWYILDGWGGIHKVGDVPAVPAGSAWWPGWDICRALRFMCVAAIAQAPSP